MDRQDDPWYPQHRPEQAPEALWRPPGPDTEPPRVPAPKGPSTDHSRLPIHTHTVRRSKVPRQSSSGAHAGPPPPAHPPTGRVHINEDLDLDELDPLGRARHREAVQAARRAHPNTRRRKAMRATAGACAGMVLAVAAVGTYAYEHLFGEVATESLDSLTDRPAEAKADRFGNVPENILVLGSQTRDGQHGLNLGNSSKLGTDISDTAMLVHINAERKWATVVSIPRDLEAPRPQCKGRLDPTQTVPASPAAMFDLAMNLGGPTCAVATVEQMTGIRIDHFMEITFNAFQSLTDAVGGVTVCVPPPGINDPHYSGLVLGPGLHTVSGAESLAFVRDRHGLENGTDLNRIRMQQMFVSSLFNKLESAGTLGDPITLYKIANAVTSNLTVDTGLDSIDAMVGLAGSVQSLKSHYIQFLTVPYGFDPTNQNRVIPGAGYNQVWADLRQDTPLPGSNAAAAFGTQSNEVAASPSSGATAAGTDPGAGTSTPGSQNPALKSVPVEVYNATQVPHLALYASQNLKAMGMAATVGYSTKYAEHFSGLPGTEILYPANEATQADALATQIGGTVTTLQTSSVTSMTLVVGPSAPPTLIAAPEGTTASTTATASSSSPTSSAISAESRNGDENICSDLPATVKYGGRP